MIERPGPQTDLSTAAVSELAPEPPAISTRKRSRQATATRSAPRSSHPDPRARRTDSQISQAGRIRERGRRLLAELAESDHYAELLSYAAKRLVRLGLNCDPADLVHEAVLALLVGLDDRPEGRHPRWADLRDTPSFLNYLKQVIKSTATNMGRHQRCLRFACLDPVGEPAEFSDHYCGQLTAVVQPDLDVELRDLRRILFAHLRGRAPGRLRKMMKGWQRDFLWAGNIPLSGGHRQYRAELRALARQVLNEIEPWVWAVRKPGPVTQGGSSRNFAPNAADKSL